MHPPPQHPLRRPAWTVRVALAVAAILLIGLGVAVGRLIPDSGPAGPARLAAAGGTVRSRPSLSPQASQARPGQCTNPQFETSAPTGGWSDAGYYLYNNMWNAAHYSVQQTLYACSYANWYVVATMNNDSGDGAVKTDPNVQVNFNEPAISSFHSISSTFSEASPDVGIYDDAYDIWINGVARPGDTELMIWNQNHGQTPAGSVVAIASFGGRTYQVWKYNGGTGGPFPGYYVAFVAEPAFTSGTVDLLPFFDWVIKQRWIPASSTLGQIDYGAEIVSTNSTPEKFSFTGFSISTS
jgi:Glycosyl hydrolase family 12